MESLKLCDSEYRFMTIVWENAPISSGELVKLCSDKLGWKKSTTYTAIKNDIMDSFVEYKSLYYEKTNQFKIIQPRNLSHKRRGSASREQAVDIAFFLNIND